MSCWHGLMSWSLTEESQSWVHVPSRCHGVALSADSRGCCRHFPARAQKGSSISASESQWSLSLCSCLYENAFYGADYFLSVWLLQTESPFNTHLAPWSSPAPAVAPAAAPAASRSPCSAERSVLCEYASLLCTSAGGFPAAWLSSAAPPSVWPDHCCPLPIGKCNAAIKNMAAFLLPLVVQPDGHWE